MATKFAQSSGSYEKKVPDSGDAAFGGSKQDGKKFTKGINTPTDSLKKPSDKGQGTKYIGEQHAS